MPIRQRRLTALNAVTATTTSKKFWVGGAKRLCLLFRAAAITSGNGAFSVKASPEPFELASNVSFDEVNNPHGGAGVTVTTLNMLVDNAANTNAQNIARVASKTVSANGDAYVWIEAEWLVNWLEITVTRTTDGTYSAYIMVEEELPSIAGY